MAVFQADGAIVEFGDAFHEVEPQARALVTGIGTLGGKEFLEDPAPGKVRDARALIRHSHQELVALRADGDGDLALIRTEVDSILDEVGHSLFDEKGIAADDRLPDPVHDDLQALLFDQWVKAFDDGL